MDKKLSVAFVWHMHQPSYKDETTGQYIMPWVRLHAIKDYLDMLLILDEFPNMKQTFNLVPLLLEQFQDYAEHNAHDIHSKYTISDVSDLTMEDRSYILDYFFDANYTNMIEPNEQYKLLYEKRFAKNFSVEDFSPQEFSDLMAWFNLVWFDPYWVEKDSEIKALIDKGKNYTQQDRIRIIEIQRNIIKQIIPMYKKRWEEGKIEISTSPYYHPILPLLINFDSALVAKPNIHLPDTCSQFKNDAKEQILKSFEKFQNVFGKKPVGIWPSEQCISPEVMDLLAEMEVKWTIADEGILAKTIKKEFVRSFRGVSEDPFDLCKAYCYKKDGKEVNITFRDSVLANLLNFEYGNHKPEEAANDFYERIKTIQSKLNSSPDENHIVTIALDGENCWESYQKDGRDFLLALYSMISEDPSLETVTISEYLDNAGYQKTLKSIYSGSWINKNFQLWIGEPTKNLAWDYLNRTRQDFQDIISSNNYDLSTIQKAKEEIYISQGSDWFWWYGEPNDSGQDDLFDLLFRSHLQNVYKILKKPIPQHLNIPLESFIGKPSKIPKDLISPNINGIIDSITEWDNAGCIEMHNGPTYISDKLFDKIFFGNDKQNIYFRLDINKFRLFNSKSDVYTNEISIYFNNPSFKHFSPVRSRNKGENVPQILKYTYSHELQIPICQGQILSPVFSEAMDNSLWKVNLSHNINYNFSDILEISIPFENICLEPNQKVYFIIAICKATILNEVIPLDQAIHLERPSQVSLLNL